MNASTLRFFLIVSRPSGTFILVAAGVVAYAGYIASIDPPSVEQAFGIAAVLQLFAASTGYRGQLRRGHFDPILAGGSRPWRIAAAHWAVSVGLGVAVWASLAAIEVVARRESVVGLMPSQIAVFIYASTIVWTLTLPFPRFSGAVLWLAVLVVLGSSQQIQALRVTFTPVPATWAETWRSAGSVFLVPPLLLLNPAVAAASLIAATFGAAVVAWIAGAVMIGRFERALVEDR